MAQSHGVSQQQTDLHSQTANSNAAATMVPPNGNQPRAEGDQNKNPDIPINLQPNVRVKVDGAGLDTFAPVIPEIRTEDIKELFKVKYLTKLEGGPTYNWMEKVEKELGRNALAVKCSFGGEKSGCLGTVYNNTRLKAKSGHDWIVPPSQGAFPTFPNGATLGQRNTTQLRIHRAQKGSQGRQDMQGDPQREC